MFLLTQLYETSPLLLFWSNRLQENKCIEWSCYQRLRQTTIRKKNIYECWRLEGNCDWVNALVETILFGTRRSWLNQILANWHRHLASRYQGSSLLFSINSFYYFIVYLFIYLDLNNKSSRHPILTICFFSKFQTLFIR